MRRSLMWKLVAAFLGVSLFAIALVTAVSALVTANEFDRFISQDAQNAFVSFVGDYFYAHSSLAGLDKAVLARAQRDQLAGADVPPFISFIMTDREGIVINPGEGYAIGVTLSPDTLATATPLAVDGKEIGYILPLRKLPPNNRAQTEYLQRSVTILAYASGLTALGAILVGVWLARTITRPVRELTGAAQKMAKGELGQTVRVHSRDEVGALALAFNQLSTDLQLADQNRKQMTADIAHELRNPLTVIAGYLDAMQSGSLQPTPKRLGVVHDEIQHLEQIVQDLRTLSLADAHALVLNPMDLSPKQVVERVAARFAPQAGQKQITIQVETKDSLPMFKADEARLLQVLDNLMSNALRHTPREGTIRLAALKSENMIRLSIADSGPGISPEDVPFVFERFYRADKARSSGENSSGLGLPIAKAIIEAHAGRIWVESNRESGASFFVELPMRHE